jgi:hypothetical protein
VEGGRTVRPKTQGDGAGEEYNRGKWKKKKERHSIKFIHET